MSPLAQQTVAKTASITLSQQLVAEELKAVDRVILNVVGEEIPLIRDIAKHIVASGGKRLRPLLTLLSARLCGYQGDRHIKLAAAVEFIHTATLLHDDVVDESKLRRGYATANELFGNKASVLVGDFLLSQAFRIMVADGSMQVLDILSNAAAVISKGEVLQLMTAGNLETDVDSYLEVISSKTATLFAAATEIGAVVANRKEEQTALKEFGQAIGTAFQLVDDALDYSADQALLGKTIGDDFRDCKITLPVIIAFQKADEEEKAFWRRTLEEGNQQDNDLEKAITYFNKHKALGETLAFAQDFCTRASRSLKIFTDCPEKRALEEIVEFCTERAF